MNQQPQRIYEFSPFQLDAAEDLLLSDGENVPLTEEANLTANISLLRKA